MIVKKSILLTATKTGGHLLPATSVAMALNRLTHDLDIQMITSGAAIEDTILKGTNLKLHVIRSGRIKGTGHVKQLLNMGQLPVALVSAMRLIRKLHPSAVIGFGGFTTGPVLAAAFILGIPTAILEANSIPGLTNRLSGKFVNKVFLTFESSRKYFAKNKTELTGTPVRHEIMMIKKGRYPGPAKHILVFGGSQGARYLNEYIPKILAKTARNIQGLTVLHQAGQNGVDDTIRAYKNAGVDATVSAYMHDMAGAYKWADFVVGRAGAGTVSELIEIGLPSLLIPFPAAADDHQYYNALALKDAGAAMLVRQEDIDIDQLSRSLTNVLSSPDKLNNMTGAARAMARGNAAATIAKKLLKMAGV